MRTLRVLAILTKRQMADDGPLLIAAFAGAIGFLFLLGLFAFLYPRSLLLHVASILLFLPSLVGLGFFLLGAVQVHGDESRGIAPALFARSVPPGTIILARLATGMVFVVIVAGSLTLAIAGAVLSGLVQWPESLIPEGLIDLFVALLLIGLACYFLGTLVGRAAGSWTRSLWLWPLALVVVSLVIIKGLGWPLAAVLLSFTAAAFLHLLTARSHARCASIALGIVVLILVGVSVFWLRCSCDMFTSLLMLEALEDSDQTAITLYRDFRPTTDFDTRSEFIAHCKIRSGHFPWGYGEVHFLLRPIGIMSYLQAKEPAGWPINPSHFGRFWGLYFDERKGLLVHRGTGGTRYAGPEGVAEAPSESLGRFRSPLVYTTRGSVRIVFDRQSNCFYAVNFREQDVCRGLALQDTAFRPVDPIAPELGSGICSATFHYPNLGYRKDMLYASDEGNRYVPLVDESGAIAVLDVRTWRLLEGVGRLPRPRTFFGRGSSRPADLFDYDTDVIVKQPEGEYAGLISACVSRQGDHVTSAVFDKNGRLLDESRGRGGFHPVLLFTPKYFVESLHPPNLTLASFFTAYSFEAGATHRALFLMPNSFVALQRDREASPTIQLLTALLLLLPALAFAGVLSWRVVRDAALLGLSWHVRWLWGLGTLAFGLPAYLTYRLTRPRVVLALCRNCGHGRRVDRDVCHHCGAAWEGSVLEAPAWRITSVPG